jgi:hypothetical protein
MKSKDAIAEGRAAWAQIRQRALSTWTNWLSVGHALIAGRNAVMRQTGSNRPFGGKYNQAMGVWLKANGFETINTQERYSAIKCAESETEIEAWRETLNDVQRRRYQSANANLNYWKRATRPTKPASPRGVHNGKSARVVELETQVGELQARIAELEGLLGEWRDLATCLYRKEEDHGAFASAAP